MQKFFRSCEKVRMGIECTDRELNVLILNVLNVLGIECTDTDLCKFKSSQKDISRPVARFLEIFYSKSGGFDC